MNDMTVVKYCCVYKERKKEKKKEKKKERKKERKKEKTNQIKIN